MMLSITVTTALDCVPLGAGAETPHVSIVPAKAEPERTHVKASVARNRFMVVAPVFEVQKTMQKVLHLGR